MASPFISMKSTQWRSGWFSSERATPRDGKMESICYQSDRWIERQNDNGNNLIENSDKRVKWTIKVQE